jgi:hypothetical protein
MPTISASRSSLLVLTAVPKRRTAMTELRSFGAWTRDQGLGARGSGLGGDSKKRRDWATESQATSPEPLIKVVGFEVEAGAGHAAHLLRTHRGHAVLRLQHAIDEEKRLVDDDQPIAVE